jgi:hypothetical protein
MLPDATEIQINYRYSHNLHMLFDHVVRDDSVLPKQYINEHMRSSCMILNGPI